MWSLIKKSCIRKVTSSKFSSSFIVARIIILEYSTFFFTGRHDIAERKNGIVLLQAHIHSINHFVDIFLL